MNGIDFQHEELGAPCKNIVRHSCEENSSRRSRAEFEEVSRGVMPFDLVKKPTGGDEVARAV
jgi:hypothetical protein